MAERRLGRHKSLHRRRRLTALGHLMWVTAQTTVNLGRDVNEFLVNLDPPLVPGREERFRRHEPDETCEADLCRLALSR